MTLNFSTFALMQVHYSLDQLPKFRHAVVTIGSFDGVHLGHLEILRQVQALAKEQGGESVVVTFDPHPRIALGKAKGLQLLTVTSEKISRLAIAGMQHCVVVPFDSTFAEQSPQAYIEDFLLSTLGAKTIVIGYDHRFGKNRQGNVKLLSSYCRNAGVRVVQVAEQQVTDLAISSTRIRKALQGGKIARANALLGYEYPIQGVVIKGEQLGRKLGFPTANIKPPHPHKLIPADGIYAAQVQIENRLLQGMLYIGRKPTLQGEHSRSIEVHIFDYNNDLYGAEIQIRCSKKIREDRTFESLNALQQQLQLDQQASLEHFKNPLPHVATVILNYNGRDYLERFLPVLLNSSYANHRIIVADNASTDDSLAFLQSQYKAEVELILLDQNHGFAQGYNEALAQVKQADYVVLLNSDVQVTEDWLQPLVTAMEADPTLAACQPKILAHHQNRLFEHAGAAGGWIDVLGYAFCRGRIFDHVEEDIGQYENPSDCHWASGAAMMIRPELYRNIGGLDGSYFAHYEEIDLCWRLCRAGYRIFCVPSSVVYHVGGGTLNYQSPRKKFFNFRNSLYTLYKNSSVLKLLWALPLRMLLDGVAGLLFLTQKDMAGIGAIGKAHWAFYRNIFSLHIRKNKESEWIESVRIAAPNRKGIFRGSIVWAYYIAGKRNFRKLFDSQKPQQDLSAH